MAERTSRKKRNIKAKNQRMILAIGITSIMKEQKKKKLSTQLELST
jgi:hypothetical protein